ncbi:MAG: ORF6N domain-containing protein [Bacteroidetes bacterium]|nr:ORF6N domain-containing protein [Bacteroidota bacterium]
MSDLIRSENILSQIYYFRGVKVMLDFHLAALYDVETRVLNQAVQRNIERFPEDFMFQLSDNEIKNLTSQFEDYKSKYLDLFEKVKSDHQKEKDSILEDVDFELELIHRDEVNVAYILKLLARPKQAEGKEIQQHKKIIIDLLAGEVNLRSKRELIEKFIEENLPHIEDADAIPDEFEKFWNHQKILAIGKICEDEHLDQKQFKALIDAYIYSDQEPIRDEVFKCLDNRPSVLKAREIGERIITKMKEFIEIFIFIKGVAA